MHWKESLSLMFSMLGCLNSFVVLLFVYFFQFINKLSFSSFSYYRVRGTSLHVTIFMLALLMDRDFNFGVVKTFSCHALLAYGCVDETFGQI